MGCVSTHPARLLTSAEIGVTEPGVKGLDGVFGGFFFLVLLRVRSVGRDVGPLSCPQTVQTVAKLLPRGLGTDRHPREGGDPERTKRSESELARGKRGLTERRRRRTNNPIQKTFMCNLRR